MLKDVLAPAALLLAVTACGGTGETCDDPGTSNGCPDGFGCQISMTPPVDDFIEFDSGGNAIGFMGCFSPEDAVLSVCFELCESTADCEQGEVCDGGFLFPNFTTCRTNPPPSLPEMAVCSEFR